MAGGGAVGRYGSDNKCGLYKLTVLFTNNF